jgi:hypothetical protein
MKRNLTMLLGVLLVTSLVACSDDATPSATDGGTKDAVTQIDGTAGSDGASSSSREQVFNTMRIPTTPGDAQKYAFDYNSDGSKDNALGGILAALVAAVPGMDMQGELDQNMRNGRAVLLVRVSAKDFTDDANATLQGWTGAEASCCAAKPCSVTDANASCFSGSHSFTVSAASPPNAVLPGTIAGGRLEMGPGKLEVLLPIGKFPAKVMLKQARLQGMLTAGGIVDGVLMGVVTKADLDSQVVPSVAKVLDGEYNDPSTKQTVKDAIKAAFDTNQDGTIDTGEVAASPLIKALLAGDVDVDQDGTKELSAGIGFTSVGCTISL